MTPLFGKKKPVVEEEKECPVCHTRIKPHLGKYVCPRCGVEV